MSHIRVVKFLLSASSVWGAATALAGAVPDLYHGADLKHGEQLIAEHKCTACHQRKFGGDGNGQSQGYDQCFRFHGQLRLKKLGMEKAPCAYNAPLPRRG